MSGSGWSSQYKCVVSGSGWSSAAVAGVSAAVVILLVAAAAAVIYKLKESEYYIQLIEQDGNKRFIVCATCQNMYFHSQSSLYVTEIVVIVQTGSTARPNNEVI